MAIGKGITPSKKNCKKLESAVIIQIELGEK